MLIGAPRSSRSVTVTPGKADSIANKTLWKLSQETFETSYLVGFTSRLMSESIGINRRRSSKTLSTGPSIVASSKYQMLMGDLTLLAISSLLLARLINHQDEVLRGFGRRSPYRLHCLFLAISSTAKANRTGPSGSPCWTPVSERIVSLPITRWLLVAKSVDAKRRIDGALDKQASRKWSRLTVLSAIFISNLTSTLFPSITGDWTKARTAYAAASHQPLMPTPSWTGSSCLCSSRVTRFAAIFEATRRKTLPTAIGGMPPSFFRSVIKFAAKRRSRACLGIWPRRCFEQRLAKAFNKRRPASAVCGATISFKCLGRSPSTPLALLGRNYFRATITSSSEIDDVWDTGSVGGGRKSRWDGGCFSLSAVTPSDVGVTTLSSDAIILTVAVTSPTISLELTIFLKSVAHGDGRLVPSIERPDRPRMM